MSKSAGPWSQNHLRCTTRRRRPLEALTAPLRSGKNLKSQLRFPIYGPAASPALHERTPSPEWPEKTRDSSGDVCAMRLGTMRALVFTATSLPASRGRTATLKVQLLCTRVRRIPHWHYSPEGHKRPCNTVELVRLPILIEKDTFQYAFEKCLPLSACIRAEVRYKI